MNNFYTDLVETIGANQETGLADDLKEEKLCPNCNSVMVVRRSRFGKLFYGCPQFPRCRGIISIN
jgi:ssDNA-binding Zn-finger/Zn-ribbon topoisomerase 1